MVPCQTVALNVESDSKEIETMDYENAPCSCCSCLFRQRLTKF